MKFTVYEKSSRLVLRWGSTSATQEEFEESLAENEAVKFGVAVDDTTFMLDDDDEAVPLLTMFTQEELAMNVNRERSRRIELGKVINGVMVTGRDEDTRNLISLGFGASLRMSLNDITTITVFRDGNNDYHNLTPPQVIDLWQKSAEYVQALYDKSWALKAMTPIPQDYDNDTYWPEK